MEKHIFLKKGFSELLFLFIASILCTTFMNDTKRINFVWGKQKSVKKLISPKYNFFSMVSPVYSHWQQCFLEKLSHQRFFPLKLFSKYKFQLLSSFFCAPLIFYYKLFKSSLERIVFCEEKNLQKRIFLFYLRNSVLPLITLSKYLLWKHLPKKNIFFRVVFFYLSSYVAPLTNHTKPI